MFLKGGRSQEAQSHADAFFLPKFITVKFMSTGSERGQESHKQTPLLKEGDIRSKELAFPPTGSAAAACNSERT